MALNAVPLVKNSLSVFDCTQTDEGLRVLDVDPSIICDRSSDVEYGTMYGWAVLTLPLYSIGIPLLFTGVLYKNRLAIKADQTLREYGSGETTASNPNLKIRKRYSRLCASLAAVLCRCACCTDTVTLEKLADNDFRHEKYYWRIVSLTRKLLLSMTTVLANKYPMFQASVSTGVMFGSYVLHSNHLPYMQQRSLAQTLSDLNKLKQKMHQSGMEEADDPAVDEITAGAKGAGLMYTFNFNSLESSLLVTSGTRCDVRNRISCKL